LVPPFDEQTAIVRFLDHADRLIKRYIKAKQKLIKLLNEQKQAIIQQAVTRGLDPNVRLKPSGVEWLEDIPEHWQVVRSKRLFAIRKELARPDDVQLSATQAYGVIKQAEFEQMVGRRVVKIFMHLEKRRHVEKDDFVISMRSFQGGLERAWASGAIRSSYIVLKPASCVDVTFFSYLLKSSGYIRALQATANFIRDGQDLTYENFRCVDLPLIPIDEQRVIASYITNATSRIDTNISRLRRELEFLWEYHKRLIADVVTGKLDVREAASKLPADLEQMDPAEENEILVEDAENPEELEMAGEGDEVEA
jgi:type I restriction enzyme S subunit